MRTKIRKKKKSYHRKKGKKVKSHTQTYHVTVDPIPVISYTLRDSKTGRIVGRTSKLPKEIKKIRKKARMMILPEDRLYGLYQGAHKTFIKDKEGKTVLFKKPIHATKGLEMFNIPRGSKSITIRKIKPSKIKDREVKIVTEKGLIINKTM